jgi:hypothetical protein
MGKHNLPPWSAKDTTHLRDEVQALNVPVLGPQVLSHHMLNPTWSCPPSHSCVHLVIQYRPRSPGARRTQTLHPVKVISDDHASGGHNLPQGEDRRQSVVDRCDQ